MLTAIGVGSAEKIKGENMTTEAETTEKQNNTGSLPLERMLATALQGNSVAPEDALQILRCSDDELLEVIAAASKVRRHFFGKKVKLNYLVSVKSGLCPEDCHYCSQSVKSAANILQYSWLSREEVAQAVARGVAGGASTICLVASGRGPSDRDINKVKGYVDDIRSAYPDVHICACLGQIDEDKSSKLLEAGVDRYNHNLNTAESAYSAICSTHQYQDRCDSLRSAKAAGISACSGLIAGLGETDEQLVEVAYALRELEVDSVPVNFLLPFEGTPMEYKNQLSPQRCLKILAMMRFVHPNAEVRSAAGREYHIRSLQPLVLEIANSIFLGDYLTSEGQGANKDLEMIKDLGFEIEQSGSGEVCFGDNTPADLDEVVLGEAESAADIDGAGIRIRHRGAGKETVLKRQERKAQAAAKCCGKQG